MSSLKIKKMPYTNLQPLVKNYRNKTKSSIEPYEHDKSKKTNEKSLDRDERNKPKFIYSRSKKSEAGA
jgi:hypothetical protein